jgi:O-antigen/teichoic acid export membrane protein
MSEPTPDGTAGHREQRERRARWTSITSMAGRGVSVLASLVSVPLTLKLLGKDGYGIWVTATTVLGWVSMADLGLGHGVTNQLSAMHGADDREGARRVISSAAGMVGLISLGLAVLGAAALVFVPWRAALSAPDSLSDQALVATVGISMGLFLVNFLSNPFSKIFAAYQEGYVLNYFGLATPLLVLGALGLCAYFQPSMPYIVLALSGVPALPSLVGLAYMLAVRRPWLRPSLAAYDGAMARGLLNTGAAFLIPQIAAIGAWESDYIIVLRVLGPAAVATYATIFRLPSTFQGLLSMWLFPLWPAYAEAAARGDIAWVRQRYRRSLIRTMAMASAGSVGLVLLGRPVVAFWTQGQIEATFSLLLPMAATLLTGSWCLVHAMALNGLGQLRGQAYYGSISAIVNVILSFVLAKTMGLAGVSWATSLATAIPGVLAYLELRATLNERTLAAEKLAHG